MNMHKRKILALAVTSAFAGSALAAPVAVNMDNPPSTAAATVASEIIAGSAVPAGFVTNGRTGWGFSPNTNIYVRYDLSGSATFLSSTPTLLMNDATGTVGANVSIALSQGGAGASNAIYQVTANSTSTAVQDTNANLVLTIAGNGIASPASSGTVTLTQSVYDTSANAVAGGSTGRLSTKAANLVTYSPSYSFSVTTGSAQTADVNAASGVYKGFTGAVSTTTAALGAISIANASTPPLANGAGTSTANTVLGSTSVLTVTGDFTAAANANGTYTTPALSRVFLGSTTCAGSGNVSANSLTATTATFPLNYATASGGNGTVCLTIEGNTAIPAASYTAVYTAKAATGYTAAAATSSASLGSISRNGGQLTSPWFTLAPGWISRFILTNTSSQAAPYSISVVTESGNTATTVPAGLSGTVPANGMVVINAGDFVSSFSGSTRAAATFTFQSGRSNINGVYQVVNATSGAITNQTMVAPGTN
jgi:hypothetical protein